MDDATQLLRQELSRQFFDFHDNLHKSAVKECVYQYLIIEQIMGRVGKVTIPQRVVHFVQDVKVRKSLEERIEGHDFSLDFSNRDVPFSLRTHLLEAYVHHQVATYLEGLGEFQVHLSARMGDALSKPVGYEFEKHIKAQMGNRNLPQEARDAIPKLVEQFGAATVAQQLHMMDSTVNEAYANDLWRSLIQKPGAEPRRGAYGTFVARSEQYIRLPPDHKIYINKILFDNLHKARRLRFAQLTQGPFDDKKPDDFALDFHLVVNGFMRGGASLNNLVTVDGKYTFNSRDNDLAKAYDLADLLLDEYFQLETALMTVSQTSLDVPHTRHLRKK